MHWTVLVVNHSSNYPVEGSYLFVLERQYSVQIYSFVYKKVLKQLEGTGTEGKTVFVYFLFQNSKYSFNYVGCK